MDSQSCQIETSVAFDTGTAPDGGGRATAPLASCGGHAPEQTSFSPYPIHLVGVNRSLFIARQHLLCVLSLLDVYDVVVIERDGCTTIDLTCVCI